MAQSPKDALITLLHRAYEPIAALEGALGIVVSTEDMRPRIEALHDAVRAYSSGTVPLHSANSRLSVEHLARDAKLLQQLTDQPLHPSITQRAAVVGTQVLVPGAQPNATNPAMARSELKQGYTTYGVLFVALLAEAADRNFRTRQDTGNAQVEEIATLEHMAREAGAKGVQLADLAAHAWDPVVKAHLQKKATQQPKKISAKEALALLGSMIKSIDATLAKIDKAHMAFASSQLVFYEQSRDVVKQMAMQGMNVAGKFVQASLQAGMGKGRGM